MTIDPKFPLTKPVPGLKTYLSMNLKLTLTNCYKSWVLLWYSGENHVSKAKNVILKIQSK